ncbi:sialate O-acetylesterase [Mastacembelus armatus]|uniref:Sialic acid acetylesterase n=1 Tax=Mastacembelus armatus TaxID=205130 RepID=A0A3Q3KVR1_9TELE|nr:sialate O-acetylesterase [Mastacembelus armatus]XP_026171225.1 sialate O-acetylesterase [Mastacembelus armatus]
MAETLLFAVLMLLASLHDSDGSLRFASYYGDHMVLQKSPERAVLWGYGPEGAQVTVSLSGPINHKTLPVTVTEGIWRVSLNPVDAGGPYNVTAAIHNSTVILTDVLFGDVWLCGGQSNMYFQMSQIFNASEELALAAKYPFVRTFMAALNLSKTEQIDLILVELPWSVPTSGNLVSFSAVCWLFGRYMYDYLKYPIGLVESCWGGTPVEAWSSSRALQQCGLGQTEDSPKDENSVLWNAMIHPLLNMTLKGAIWYQGESNANYHQDNYNCSFPAMIDDWRMAFHQGSGGQTAMDFPFGFVQLSTYQKESTDNGFPEIRWHQTADFGFVPNPRMKQTFMAVALDLPDATSPYGTIHPRYKQDVAYRLTLGARAVAYKEKDVPFQGPFCNQIILTQTYVHITYDQEVSVTPSKDIFEICCSKIKEQCGPKSLWVPAPIIQWDLKTVQLSISSCPSDEVAALRYAWRDWPCDFKACPIYSASGILPAPPFIANQYQRYGP